MIALPQEPCLPTPNSLGLRKGTIAMDLAVLGRYLAVPLAIIPLYAVGMALGNIFSTAITWVARNPSSRDQIFPLTILGFAMTEAIALFALLIGFLILFS